MIVIGAPCASPLLGSATNKPKPVPMLESVVTTDQPGNLVLADEIPISHTPPGGYGPTFPPPVLASCTEPLITGAPDLRGIWRVIGATRGGQPVPDGDRLLSYTERIEQCGNRIVDMGGGTIADAQADGTEENGVHDVSVFDYRTPIHVIATYDDEVFVLRPVGIPGIEVTRRLNADGHMIWTRPDMGGIVVTLERDTSHR